ncbi:MAG: cofactor-independent phosphoglycerate mutase [Lachnospiraceae bacterium]|nr:cofactor-independent phosphoglycerate mutase [Lachnospiraceae bacterium]
MKYLIILGDGMADEPIAELGNRTCLAYAKTPAMDEMAPFSEVGLVKTIPEGMSPGSDTANLAVLGYDPARYYSGRSPLEALSIGVPMKDTDVAIRCNIVTISDDDVPFEEKTILDHSSGEISTEDAAVLLKAVADELADETYRFYVGTSYRHCLIVNNGKVMDLTAPHDVLTQTIGQHLPKDPALLAMMKKSHEILDHHPVNEARRAAGLNPANCCWFWGAGTKPMLSSFEEKNHKKGVMISAVDLLKGIAIGAGMKVIKVEGANGGLNTNYEGKADAAVKALLEDGFDFAYIHVEAPDEMGHQGSYERKVRSIEYLDSRVIARVKERMEQAGADFRMLVMPDHPTPVRIRTHSAEPVPYMLYDSTAKKVADRPYNEETAKASGIFVPEGYTLIDRLFEK